MTTCLVCDKETATRHGHYCIDHYGGRNAPNYLDCPATLSLGKNRMFDQTESKTFNLLCGVHKLSEQPLEVQPLFVNWFFLLILIRREMKALKSGEGRDIGTVNALIKTHLSVANKLGIGRTTTTKDEFGIFEFLTGDNGNDVK